MPVPILAQPVLMYGAAFNHVRETGHATGLLMNDDPNTRHLGITCIECEEGWRSPMPGAGQSHYWPHGLSSGSVKERVIYLNEGFRRALEEHRGQVPRKSAWQRLMEDE